MNLAQIQLIPSSIYIVELSFKSYSTLTPILVWNELFFHMNMWYLYVILGYAFQVRVTRRV